MTEYAKLPWRRLYCSLPSVSCLWPTTPFQESLRYGMNGMNGVLGHILDCNTVLGRGQTTLAYEINFGKNHAPGARYIMTY